MSDLLIFGERPERISHSCLFLVSDLSKYLKVAHFLVSNLSDSLTVTLLSWVTWATHSHPSLKKREWVNCLLKKTFKKLQKNVHRNTILLKHFWANCSFFVRERAPWANCSWSLFIMSDLSDLLTVAHLCEAIWANRSQSLIKRSDFEQMREFQTLDFRSPWHEASFYIKEQVQKNVKSEF